MKLRAILLGISGVLWAAAAGAQPAVTSAKGGLTPVASPLTSEILKILPEAASGYLDLNSNGKLDTGDDLEEAIPESRIKDGQLQVQEILDFVLANWRFISLSKLQSLQKAVKGASGPLGELIAIDFGTSLGEAAKNREAMGDGLYLTPSAYKKAMETLTDIISTMSLSYKKEGAKNEADFVAARDKLFSLIEKGYPLPQNLPAEEKANLSTAMIGTLLKEKTSNPARAKVAMRTLGQLKTQEAGSYLMEFAEIPEYKIEALKTLGDIGVKSALPLMVRELKTSPLPEVKKAALQSIGRVGGAEGLDTLLDLSKPANRNNLNGELLETLVGALAAVVRGGNPDLRVQTALKEFVTSDAPGIRKAALGGLGEFANSTSLETLLASLNTERDTSVRTALVNALAKQRGEGIIGAYQKVLREKDLDSTLKTTILTVLADVPGGIGAVQNLVEALGDPAVGVRTAAAASLLKLYPANTQAVSGALTRGALTAKDDQTIIESTGLLAAVADPTTLPALLTLLQKNIPEVKENAAWAFYRIHSASLPKAVEELQKLIANESETLAVRINAVRAVGAMGYDTPQLNLVQTLITTSRMRGDKYALLRLFAIRSLAQLNNPSEAVISNLARLASRDSDNEIRKEAVSALQKLASAHPESREILISAFKSAEEVELQVRILEALADMDSDRVAELAPALLTEQVAPALKRRVLYALARTGTEEAAKTLLEAAKDSKMTEAALALLEGFPSSLMKVLVPRRLKAETNKDLLPVLEALDLKFGDKP